MLQAGDQVKDAVCTLPFIVFVESTYCIMVNHHKGKRDDGFYDTPDASRLIYHHPTSCCSCSCCCTQRGGESHEFCPSEFLSHQENIFLEIFHFHVTDAEKSMCALVFSHQSGRFQPSVYFQLCHLCTVNFNARCLLLSFFHRQISKLVPFYGAVLSKLWLFSQKFSNRMTLNSN